MTNIQDFEMLKFTLLICFSFLNTILANTIDNESEAIEKRSDCFDHGIDYFGFDMEEGVYVSTGSAEACQLNCQSTSGCEYWTWDPNYHSACWRKYAKGEMHHDSSMISGPKYCGDEPPTNNIGVMSYNMYGWNALHDPIKTENMYKIIRTFKPDLFGAQEDEGMGDEIAANIGSDYK